MSNEKLSELSKPVDIRNWKMDSWRAAPCNGTEWAKGYFEGWNKYHSKVEEHAPVYSQEYVSTLLQRIASQDDHINQQQDRIESLEKKNGDLGKALGAAEKRLVHIKDACDTWERKAISNFEECATMSQRIEELEKRLATPVRLKKVDSSNVPFAGDGFNAAVDYCAEAIRAAGFAVGDE